MLCYSEEVGALVHKMGGDGGMVFPNIDIRDL
jgi:hypothetical protein